MSEGIDVARSIFLNGRGDIRCGWRVVAFVLAVIASGLILGSVLQAFTAAFPSLWFLAAEPANSNAGLDGRELSFVITNKLVTFGAVVVATVVCARLLERRPFWSVGFRLHRGWFRDVVFGSALGAASLALAVGLLFVSKAVRFEAPAQRDMSLGYGLIVALAFMLVSAATEELMFRGFAFQALANDLGAATALLGTSLVFGLLHLPNPNSTALSTINTVLAGIWLGAAYLLTRSLWLVTALHYSWNLAQSFVFGLPVSGITTLNSLSLLHGICGEPGWLSGLDYGPEGGAAATIALIASTLLLWRSGLFSVSGEMINAGKPGPRETRPSIVPREDVPL